MGGVTIAHGVVIENAEGSNDDDQITGNNVNNVLTGGAGDDILNGNGGDDLLRGDLGADTLDGGAGADAMYGGAGDDNYFVAAGDVVSEVAGGGTDTIMTALNNYVLNTNFEWLELIGAARNATGNASDNVMFGNEFGNLLRGDAGNDRFLSRGGNDTVNGGAGDDVIVATRHPDFGPESNTYVGGSGFDTIDFSGCNNGVTVNLADGVARGVVDGVDLLTGIEAIIGSRYADVITGDAGDNMLAPVDGADVIDGGAGVDTLDYTNGTVSVNLMTGRAFTLDAIARFASIENVIVGNGDLTGDGGDNHLVTGFGASIVYGNGGNDVLVGGGSYDVINGGAGIDFASYETASVDVRADLSGGLGMGDAAGDIYTSIEGLLGSAFNDILIGNSGANTLNGAGGNDTLNGGAGADTMDGGSGNDTYVVDVSGDITTETSAGGGIDLVKSTVTRTLGANLEKLTLIGGAVINGTGNTLANTITGNSAANTLSGLSGADTLIGAAGGDRLICGAGLDVLSGGAGADKFVFNSAPAAADRDTITDYNVAADTIQILNTAFVGIGGVGVLAAAAFYIGASAADASDRIIYSSATGALYFDADGNGAGAQIQFATLSMGLLLTAADFVVI